MKIGIIGFGFVGKALANGLTDDVVVSKIDPKLKTSTKDLIKFKPDIIFLCLPTPMLDDGRQDLSILEGVVKDLIKYDIKSLIVIKSTILPGNINTLKNNFTDFIYNPEFLREKSADEDFINSKLIVIGGNKKNSKFLASFYTKHTKCVCEDYVFTDLITASLVKYTINSFLATKVTFFNQMFQLFKTSESSESWDNFILFISKDKRIGNSHMMVPGHDGRFGFGGACLPKDTAAIVKYAENLEIDLSLIKTAIKANNKIRLMYENQTSREEEQNISFKDH